MSPWGGTPPFMELLTMSTLELTRLGVMERLAGGELTQAQAAGQLGLSVRQVKRLWRSFSLKGPVGLQSTRRGKPSNRRLEPQIVQRALDLVHRHYPDFGPTFAAEKLRERHDLQIDHETLRRAMITAGLWKLQRKRRLRVQPPRERRPCFGELAQIDGSHHAWFEKRAPKCTLYVDIDDATSALMALHFAEEETTHGYFELTRKHALEHGLPLAFYSDKYGVFRINRQCSSEKLTQFGRAMAQLGIELICANSPQAKGRVERANGTLQQRLVRELRLRNICTIAQANDFATEFITSYNAKFARLPASESDAHRPAPDLAELDRILSHQHERTITKNLTVQFGQTHYELMVPEQARRLRHAMVTLRYDRDGQLIIERLGTPLPYRLVKTNPITPVRNAKQIAAMPLNRHSPNPKKGHVPPADHPWRIRLIGASPRGHL